MSNRDDIQLNVAVIECRTETAYVFERFFVQYPDINYSFYLLNKLYTSSILISQLSSCDLILTTATHYFEIYKNFPMLREKLLEVVTLWSQETVTKISTIPPKQRIGVLYTNPRTVHLVKSALKYFDIDQSQTDELNENTIRLLDDFVLQHDVIITEPISAFFTRPDLSFLRRRFEKQHGTMISFEHYIDEKSTQAIARAISALKWNKYTNRT